MSSERSSNEELFTDSDEDPLYEPESDGSRVEDVCPILISIL